ncbi:MAG: hypothetical protein PVJ15_09790, partial [Gammaproteobacteria bacterium]
FRLFHLIINLLPPSIPVPTRRIKHDHELNRFAHKRFAMRLIVYWSVSGPEQRPPKLARRIARLAAGN